MPNFNKLFENSKGKPINYNGKILTRFDNFAIENGESLVICIESTNSKNTQGVAVDITGSCMFNGREWNQGKGVFMVFWEKSEVYDPKNIELKICSTKGSVKIRNIWESTDHRGSSFVDYGRYGSAMILEEIPGGKKYSCNDWTPDENFDDIIFTVKKMGV
ncbi:MAG: hypothetical protein SNF33_00165 (plasmid) [Candidatus Algichlamydia australiensis]|nr:hypothetical protein [Chlamydiales bacterium]